MIALGECSPIGPPEHRASGHTSPLFRRERGPQERNVSHGYSAATPSTRPRRPLCPGLASPSPSLPRGSLPIPHSHTLYSQPPSPPSLPCTAMSTAPAAQFHEALPACLRHVPGSPSRFILTEMESHVLIVNHDHRRTRGGGAGAGVVVAPLPLSPTHPTFGSVSFSHADPYETLEDTLLLTPSQSLSVAAYTSTAPGSSEKKGKARGGSRNNTTALVGMAPPPPPEETQWLLPRGLSMGIGGPVGMKPFEPRTQVVPMRGVLCTVPCTAEDEAVSPSESGKVPAMALDSSQQSLGPLKDLVDRDFSSGAEPGPDHSVPHFPEESPAPGGVSEAQPAVRLGEEAGEAQGVCTTRKDQETQQQGGRCEVAVLSQDDVELLSAVAPDLLPGGAYGMSRHDPGHSREGLHCTCGCAADASLALPISHSLPTPPSFSAHASSGGLQPPGLGPHSRSTQALLAVRETQEVEGEDEEDEEEGLGVLGASPEPQAVAVQGLGGGAEVEISLVSLRGYSQGVSDVIGALDFDATGAFFATGGIARKVRVYSMANLAARKAELVASLEERRSKSSGEDPAGDGEGGVLEEGLEDEGDSGEGFAGDSRPWEWAKRRRQSSCELSRAAGALGGGASGVGTVPFFMREGNGGLRRKHKASSTGNLEDLFQQACRQRVREHFLDSDSCSSQMICTAAKLSSLQWVPGKSGVVGCGDYDGVFTEWDLETGMCSTERDEHQGQKIWSIRYSPDKASGLAATASEDGTVKLWVAGSEDCVSSILPCPGSAACTVDFSSDGRSLVTGGANSSLFLYDLRNLAAPLAVLQGHERTVSYCRFLNDTTVVSSSIDSTVKVWNVASAVDAASAGPVHQRRRVLSAAGTGADHTNRRNFAGLAVRGDGLMFTGSETNEMVGYRCRQGVMESHMRMDFATGQCSSGAKAESTPSLGRKPFVSALNWQGTAGTHLGAANSEGIIRIMRIL